MPLESRIPNIVRRLNDAVIDGEAAAAEVIAEGARLRVPVRTGRLREAIHVEQGSYKDSTGTRQSGVWVIAGDRDAYYGHLVEHGHKKSDGEGFVPAHPFLVPAFEESRNAQDAASREAMARRLDL